MSQKMSARRSRKRNQKKRWVPVLFGLGGLALLLVAFLALRGNGGASKAEIQVKGNPSIKVDKEQVDLGDVKLNKPVEVSFKITNVGDKTLQFEKKPYIEVVEGC